MEKKSKDFRAYPVDEQEQYASGLSARHLAKKKRRSPMIQGQDELIPGFAQPFRTNSELFSISTSQKRTRDEEEEDDDGYFLESQSINKRIRLESENEPPRAAIKRRSLVFYHPNEVNPSLSPPPSSTKSFHPSQLRISTNKISPITFPHHPSKANHFSPQQVIPPIQKPKAISPSSPSDSSTKPSKSCFTSQSNHSSPLRATNFVFDSKQQTMSATILRTGNISPAHSDTSTESTSTCSSDEQQLHPNFSLLHYPSSRSSRERENYEQLLNLAEKLADPNRFNQVDIEQFFSYRYKCVSTSDLFSSKQTACVICMSPFKSSQRIRVLPCQHEYHAKCIARWFTMNSSCPICRRDHFSLA